MAHFVNTPMAPFAPEKPRTMPLTPGPGPSPQNQPMPEPRAPVLRNSPLGMTHSRASRFSSLNPMEIVSGPGPTAEVALARGEQLEPAPVMWAFSPRFMSSAWRVAEMT